LAERAGTSGDLIKRFETTGRITLDRFLRLAIALDATAELVALFPELAPRSLDEPAQAASRRGRVYGRRSDAGKPRGPRHAATGTPASASVDDASHTAS